MNLLEKPRRIQLARKHSRNPLPDGRNVIYRDDTREAVVLEDWRAQLLAEMTSPGFLAGDVSLKSLERSGLLLDPEGVIGACRKHPRPRRAAPIRTVVVTTRDRPSELERCVSSFATHLAEKGRACRFVVLDDAPSAKSRRTTRSILARLAASHGIDISYAGVEEKRRYGEHLGKVSGVDPRIIDFGLHGPKLGATTLGANRNCMLLEGAGEPLLSTDDDLVCKLVSPPGPLRSELRVSSDHDVADLWFYATPETLKLVGRSLDDSLLDAHERLLGRSVPALIARDRAPVIAADAEFAHRLLDHRAPAPRVVLSATGMSGDSGMSNPLGFMWITGAARRRLTASERFYRAAIKSRLLFRAPLRPTITDRMGAMLGSWAIDGSELVPPFFPTFRNEDSVFCNTLAKVNSRAAFAMLPLALIHLPPGGRRYTPFSVSAANSIPRLIFESIAEYRCELERWQAPSVRQGLLGLSRHLRGLSALSKSAFLDFASWLRCTWLSADLAIVVTQLQDEPQPPFWRKEILRYKRVLEANLRLSIPTKDCALGAHLLGQMADLLEAWAPLWDAATLLKQRGVTLAQPLSS